MDQRFTDKLAQAIAAAAQAAFGEAREQRAGETFFAFTLATTDDAAYVIPCCHTEERHQRIVENAGLELSSSDDEYYRWTPAEWGVDAQTGTEHFVRVEQLLQAAHEDLAEGRFAEYREDVLQAMVQGLSFLDEQGFWGVGPERHSVTLFVSSFDSDDTGTLEDESARKLNPPLVCQRFQARFVETGRLQAQKEKQKETRRAAVSDLRPSEQVKHWIAELQRLVDARPIGPGELFAARQLPLEALNALGAHAVLHMLRFVETLAPYDDHEVDTMRFAVLDTVADMGETSLQIRRALRRLLRRYCDRNVGRELWQTTPFHLARCLHALDGGVPAPGMADNNALINYERYL